MIKSCQNMYKLNVGLWYTELVSVSSSRIICISSEGILLCFSFSILNYMLACPPSRKFGKASKFVRWTKQRYHEHTAGSNEALKSDGQFCNQLFSKYTRKTPKGEPIRRVNHYWIESLYRHYCTYYTGPNY